MLKTILLLNTYFHEIYGNIQYLIYLAIRYKDIDMALLILHYTILLNEPSH